MTLAVAALLFVVLIFDHVDQVVLVLQCGGDDDYNADYTIVMMIMRMMMVKMVMIADYDLSEKLPSMVSPVLSIREDDPLEIISLNDQSSNPNMPIVLSYCLFFFLFCFVRTQVCTYCTIVKVTLFLPESDLKYLEIIVFPRPHHSSLEIFFSILVMVAILAILAKLTPVEEFLCQSEVLNGNCWIVPHVVADHLRCKNDNSHHP